MIGFFSCILLVNAYFKRRASVFYETLKALANYPNMDETIYVQPNVATEEKTSKYAPPCVKVI